MKRRYLIILTVLAIALSMLVGFGLGRNHTLEKSWQTGSYSDDATGEDMSLRAMKAPLYSAPKERANPGAGEMGESFTPEKIIKTVSLSLKSETFDADLEKILTQTKLNGYVESSNISENRRQLRHADLSLRIAKEKLESFLQSISDVGIRVNYSETAKDVSDVYRDDSLRLETQKAMMKRLNEMLEKADDVQQMLEIHKQVAETQYMIESLSGHLKSLDKRVDFVLVNVALSEIKPEEKVKHSKGFFEKLGLVFAKSFESIGRVLEGGFFTFVFLLPHILVILLIIIIIIVIVRTIRRRKKHEKNH